MISKGKLLTDDKEISSTHLKDNDLIMILVIKSKKEKEQKQKKMESEHEEAINELMSQGFEREEVLDALRRADYNVDTALDYLENGFPDDMVPDMPNLLTMTPDQIDELGEHEFNEAIDGALEHFFTAPEFRTIRETLRNDPSQAQAMMQQLRDMNPAFYEILQDNPEIAQEIVEGVQEFGEDEIGDDSGDDEGEDEWEDVDADGNPQQLNPDRIVLCDCFRIE
jgi:UV excision repair protein RAD23